MKREILIVAVLFAAAGSVSGAVRFGLGNAVAHRSADLIDKARGTGPSTGDNVASTLPACASGAVYDSAPTDLSGISAIDPLGHVQPTGHTFPSDHIYYYVSSSAVPVPSVYAPGRIHVTEIDSTDYLNASPAFTDYKITFYACRNVRSYYGHVRMLSTALSSQLGSINQNCSTYSTGGSSYRSCSIYTDLVFESGALLGTDPPSGALDFGTTDDRITPIPFVAPLRHGTQVYTACPVDYFTAGLKSTMQAMLGRFDGGHARTTAPVCGTIDQDVANAAKGYWYHPGSPDVPEDPHLSLIDNNVYAPQQTISVGNSLSNGGGLWYIFTPASSGQIDRDFSQITADGTVYCYDTFYDPIGQPIGAFSAPTFILQMLTPTTLRFEKQGTGGCGTGPWAFTSNAVDFQR